MPHFKLLSLGGSGFPDIYRGSEKRRFGDASLIDQLLIIVFFIKTFRHNQNKLKWKINVLSKLYPLLRKKKTKKFVCSILYFKN